MLSRIPMTQTHYFNANKLFISNVSPQDFDCLYNSDCNFLSVW